MSDPAVWGDIEDREMFLLRIAEGVPPENAAYEVKWTPAKLRRYLADPEFAELVAEASDLADGTVEAALFRLATKERNLGAIQMWLYNRRPDRWKDVRRIEVKNDLTVNFGVVASTKQVLLEMMREHGPAALEPGALEDDIIDADVVA